MVLYNLSCDAAEPSVMRLEADGGARDGMGALSF
jgi:hypothetical protein